MQMKKALTNWLNGKIKEGIPLIILTYLDIT
jgi:hypothetical protein